MLSHARAHVDFLVTPLARRRMAIAWLPFASGFFAEDWLWNVALSHFLLSSLQGIKTWYGVHMDIDGELTPCALTPSRYGLTLHPRRILGIEYFSPSSWFTEEHVRCTWPLD